VTRRWPSLVLALALTTVAAAPAVAAPADEAAALAAYQQVQADTSVGAGWTGSVDGCVVGTESDASLAATLRTVNTLRDFAGVGPVGFDPVLNQRALAAALMMRAAGSLSHDPGPAWPCYSEEGATGARTSNLFRGRSGAGAMVGYADDGGVASLGHRRWLLNPGGTTFGSGSTGTTNALTVVGSTAAVAPGTLVAWPPGTPFPWDWMPEDWSLAVGNADQRVDFGETIVSVTAGGTALAVTDPESLGAGYGSAATLAWRVAVPAALRSSDQELAVTVSGMSVDGVPTPVSYVVRPFAIRAAPPVVDDDDAADEDGGAKPVAVVAFRTRPAIRRVDGRRKTIRAGTALRVSVSVRNAAKVTYAWRRNGKALRGRTSSRYRVVSRDRGARISVRVTARGRTGRSIGLTSGSVRVARR